MPAVPPRASRRRLSIVGKSSVLALLLVATYTIVPAAPDVPKAVHPEAAPVACPTEAVAQLTARAAARGCQEVVEVADLTTEFDRAWALPDGSMRWEHRYRPVRVKRDGRWTPVDTTLAAGNDGAVRPVATATAVVFSGGGPGPMVEIREGKTTLRLGSPVGGLPKPTLDGDTATYAEVLPGVDLRLTADVDGYSRLLVEADRYRG